jgi:NAD(P)-dependent dehydrogenase (short-subunit alcohol dehydrogenase family)
MTEPTVREDQVENSDFTTLRRGRIKPLNGKRVCVTGANSGFGLRIALLMATLGWESWGTVRSGPKAEVLAVAARDAGVSDRVHPVVIDVGDSDSVAKGWQELPDFHALVNNAGFSVVGAIEDTTPQQAMELLRVNLIAPAEISQMVLPGMRRLGGGRIVMISSIAAKVPVIPLNGWYHASKAALEALAKTLRIEVRSDDVKIIVIEPGRFQTQLEQDVVAACDKLASEGTAYSDAYRRLSRLLDAVQRFTPAPDKVIDVVARSLSSRAPRRKYIVGKDARAADIFRWAIKCPIGDAVVERIFGLK